MTKVGVIAMLAGLAAGATLWAMSDAALEADTNGDGVLTIDEVQAVFPDITAESFSAMDLNADGTLDDVEVTAAQDSGQMPTEASGG